MEDAVPAISLSQGMTHYELVGPPAGSPVVLVHGGTIPMWTWDAYVPALIGVGFRVLRYDMFGRGESALPSAPHDRHLFRVQLLELLDRTGLSAPVNLVGYSFGGATTLSFAARHPDRVRSLALIAPAVFYERGNAAVRLLRMPVLGPAFLRLMGLRRMAARAQEVWEGSPKGGVYADLFKRQLARRGFPRAFLSFARTDALGDYRPFLGAVGEHKLPVLLVWGDEDAEVPSEDMRSVRDAIPGIRYSELEGCTHGVVFSAEDRVLEALLQFLGAA